MKFEGVNYKQDEILNVSSLGGGKMEHSVKGQYLRFFGNAGQNGHRWGDANHEYAKYLFEKDYKYPANRVNILNKDWDIVKDKIVKQKPKKVEKVKKTGRNAYFW